MQVLSIRACKNGLCNVVVDTDEDNLAQIKHILPRKIKRSKYEVPENCISLDEFTVLECKLQTGEISDEDFMEIVSLSSERLAKKKALDLLSYRDHSKKELVQKLRRTADEQSATLAAQALENVGLVNDEAFARRYALDCIERKGLSLSATRFELSTKGIDREFAETLLEEIYPGDDFQLERLFSGKYKLTRFDEKSISRTSNALIRKGYSPRAVGAEIRKRLPDEE